MVMLGAYVSATGALQPETIESMIVHMFTGAKAKLVPLNLEAFRRGMRCGTERPVPMMISFFILPVTAAYEARPNAVADNAKIDRYNAIIKELAAEKGVYYLNVAEIR